MEEKNCDTCKYFDEDATKEPCVRCRNTVVPTTDEYKKRPFLWKAYDDETDNVNHPSHYETGKFQCWDVMEEAIGLEATMNFCLCNAFKYIYRCNHKHESPVEDIKKAIVYLGKYLELDAEYNKKG